jgi:hypothetical protein
MKIIALLTTIIYVITSIYLLYSAAMHLFVYFANTRLGHEESIKLPLLYLMGGIVFGLLVVIGYRMHQKIEVGLILKSLFYLPIIAVGIYILWAILLIISSGGTWN